MKTLLSFILIFPFLGYAQERIVLNNDGFIHIDNGAYLVIDNSDANAITTMGTGGNIISEGETNVIKWNINTATGTYTIPWATSSLVKIPQEMDITIAGSSGGHVIFSTYETTTDVNTPYPSAVTNMNYNGLNKSLFVADRFWHTDARSYTTMPSGRMILGYDPANNELGGSNTIVEANLLAQRFNTTVSHWESYILLGVNNAVNDRVTSIPFTPTDFYQDWILVDNSNPLPVLLTGFNLECNQGTVEITWQTATEVNNDFFTIERSTDAIYFESIGTVLGQGNSNQLENYHFIDDMPLDQPSYYRLKQTDFNGQFEYFGTEAISCGSSNNISIYPNPFSGNITLQLNPDIAYPIQLDILDYLGRIVHTESIGKAKTILSFDDKLAKGTYFIKVFNETTQIVERIVKK